MTTTIDPVLSVAKAIGPDACKATLDEYRAQLAKMQAGESVLGVAPCACVKRAQADLLAAWERAMDTLGWA